MRFFLKLKRRKIYRQLRKLRQWRDKALKCGTQGMMEHSIETHPMVYEIQVIREKATTWVGVELMDGATVCVSDPYTSGATWKAIHGLYWLLAGKILKRNSI